MDLVCPYCGGPFTASLVYTGSGWSEHRDLEGYECDNYECGAEWDSEGKLITAGKTPAASPGGDDEPPKASTEPSSG